MVKWARRLVRAAVLDPRLPQRRNLDNLKIGQRVVTFDEGPPLRGTVRFTGEIEDSSGEVQIVVGLELVGNPQSRGLFFNVINNNLYS